MSRDDTRSRVIRKNELLTEFYTTVLTHQMVRGFLAGLPPNVSQGSQTAQEPQDSDPVDGHADSGYARDINRYADVISLLQAAPAGDDLATMLRNIQPRMTFHVQAKLFFSIMRNGATDNARAREIQRTILRLRNEVVQGNLRLVMSIARHYAGSSVSMADRVSAGSIGLMSAFDGADTRAEFSTYAQRPIRRAIHSVIAPQWEIDRATSSLDAPVGDEAEGPSLVSNFADERTTAEGSVESRVLTQLEFAEADSFLNGLTDRELYIVIARHGLLGNEPLTLDQIGLNLGLTRERVRQIEARIHRRLREELNPDRPNRLPEGSPNADWRSRSRVVDAINGEQSAPDALRANRIQFTRPRIFAVLSTLETSGFQINEMGSAQPSESLRAAIRQATRDAFRQELEIDYFVSNTHQFLKTQGNWAAVIDTYREFQSNRSSSCADSMRR